MLHAFIACALFTLAPTPPATDRAALLDGVKFIAAPGSPGAVLALKSPAEPIVVGSTGKSGRVAVAAAASWGRGRVVALGHSGYLDAGNLAQVDTARFLENAIAWCARGRPKGELHVLAVDADLEGWLKARGYTQARGVRGSWPTDGVDVILSTRSDMSPDEQARLAAFVKSGGGLILGQTGWGWRQLHGDADMRTHPPSLLLREAGIVWTDDFASPTAAHAFTTAEVPSELLRFDAALDALFPPHGGAGSKDVQAGLTLATGLELLPDDEATVKPRLDALLKQRSRDLVIAPDHPIPAGRPADRALIAYEQIRTRRLVPRDIKGNPSAAHFPGALPTSAPLEPAERTIDLKTPGWHSLGLWAPAGGVVTVEVIEGSVPANSAIQIGSHTDRLWALETWKRVPEIVTRTPLGAKGCTLASAFGGLVYVDTPKTASGTLRIRVIGAAAAPLFMLGQTDAKDWATNRLAPGPWAELGTSKVIVTVPSDLVRALDDPRPLLELWDRILDACADLASRPRERTRPERYVADVQISAGYMHSGYPIMTHLDAAPTMADAAKLGAGSWGLFHEMGHNHQESIWTFDGTTEVTCNWFALYVMETVCGKPPIQGHDAVDKPADRAARAERHRRAGAPFDRWKSDPFLALEVYIQIREGFGWEPFKRVTAAARALPQRARPRDDAQERDWTLIAFSQATGRDLGPHFASFGIPVSPWARAVCAQLPAWAAGGH